MENAKLIDPHSLKLKTYARLTEIFDLSRAINVTNAVTDVAIAFALIFLLQRSRTGFKRSDNIINRLILFSLNTGLLTGLDAIGSLIGVRFLVWFVSISVLRDFGLECRLGRYVHLHFVLREQQPM